MSELRAMLASMVSRLFSELEESTQHSGQTWSTLEELGLPSLFLDEAHGGFNGQWQDAALVAREVGRYGLEQPLISTILGRYALAEAGHVPPAGPLLIAHCHNATVEQRGDQFHLTVNLRHFQPDPVQSIEALPFVVTGQAQQGWFVALVRTSTSTLQLTPVQALYWQDSPLSLFNLAALLHSAQIAGALERLVTMSVQYAGERQQFGRKLSQFQVIQHNVALLSEQAAAVGCAAAAAARAQDCEQTSGHTALVEIAAAKLRANRAIPLSTGIAHQVHGAIGFTEEHKLHRFTRRLLTWRNEYGNDRYWANVLGMWCLQARSEGLWQSLTARSDRHMASQYHAVEQHGAA